MKIGLFFGSFNPIHNGHLSLANYVLKNSDLDNIWFVISPHNPLKDKDSLLSESERLKMVNMSIFNSENLRASDIEFKMPKPSYTIDTLNLLKERFKENEFVIIMGTDNLENLHKWKDYEKILNEYEIYVYSRPTSDGGELKNHSKVKIFNSNLSEISSTFIRNSIKEDRDASNLMIPSVWNYIKRKGFYK